MGLLELDYIRTWGSELLQSNPTLPNRVQALYIIRLKELKKNSVIEAYAAKWLVIA